MAEKRPGGNKGSSGPQNTRVYAPTHRSAAAPPAKGQAPGSAPAGQGRGAASGAARSRTGGAPAAGTNRPAQGAVKKNPPVNRPPRAAEQILPHYGPPPRTARAAEKPGGAKPAAAPSRPGGNAGQAKKKRPAPDYASVHRLESLEQQKREREREKERARRLAKKKSKKPPDKKKIITWASVIVASVAALLLSYFLFLLQTVEVSGNAKYTAESIVSLSRLKPGTHMLLCDTEETRRSIETNPYLKVLSVTKELPRTIRITVAERTEVAAIESQDYDVIIDEEGQVLSIGKGSDLKNLLLVTGMSQLGYEVNEKIGKESDLQTQALLSIIGELRKLDLLKEVAGADLANPLRVTLTTKDGVTVVLGQPDNLADKLAWMRDALPSLRESGVAGGTLDVSAKGGASYSPPGAASAGSLSPPEPSPEAAPDSSPASQKTADKSPAPAKTARATPSPAPGM